MIDRVGDYFPSVAFPFFVFYAWTDLKDFWSFLHDDTLLNKVSVEFNRYFIHLLQNIKYLNVCTNRNNKLAYACRTNSHCDI